MGLANALMPYVIRTWDDSPDSILNLCKCLELSDEEGWTFFLRSGVIEKKIIPALTDPEGEQEELWDLISMIVAHRRGRKKLSEHVSRYAMHVFFFSKAEFVVSETREVGVGVSLDEAAIQHNLILTPKSCTPVTLADIQKSRLLVCLSEQYTVDSSVLQATAMLASTSDPKIFRRLMQVVVNIARNGISNLDQI